MIHITDKKDCCGCTACASICTHQAISMVPDELGFVYPRVDESKCVDCGLCEKVCQFNDNYDKHLNLSEPVAYATRHKDINEVMASRSGATFVALSDDVLNKGGVIYGAGYKDHFRVVHKRAVNKDERDEFRGSKYVQSDLTGIFRQVKEDLQKGLLVMFTGTPCQTAGLSSYIGKKLRENLILVDVVCHGVPGPYFWRDYLHHLEKKEKSEICWVNFRDKESFGWSAHKETFRYTGTNGDKKHYGWRFYQTIMFRESCFSCHYCNTARPSDITIGDLWGWQKINPTLNADNKGINLVLLNTEKGFKLFDEIKKQLNTYPLSAGSYLQPNLISPTKRHRKRNQFVKDYTEKGFEYVVSHQYHSKPIGERIKSKLLSFVKLVKGKK